MFDAQIAVALFAAFLLGTQNDRRAIDRDAPNPHTELQQDLHSTGDKTSSRL
jgi:hypothetical protein